MITELLRGNFEPVNKKLAEHVNAPTYFSVRPVSERKMVQSLNTRSIKIRIAGDSAYCVEEKPDSATPAQLVYGLVGRVLESDDMQRLALCRTCGKIFYRKSLKRDSCGDGCVITSITIQKIELDVTSKASGIQIRRRKGPKKGNN